MSLKNTPEAPSDAALATEAQVRHIKDLLTSDLRNLSRDDAQRIIQNGRIFQDAVRKMIDDVRGRLTNTIIRRVRVNRGRTQQQAIDATGRQQFVDAAILATMPMGDMGEGENVEIEFFLLGRDALKEEVAAEFERRGLVPDPVALAAVNEADPAFVDSHPNCTQWRLQDGGWAHLAFDRWDDERRVDVRRSDRGWRDGWWFGGRRK